VAVTYCKIRARFGGPEGDERDYYVNPASVTLLVDAGERTGIWVGTNRLHVSEPAAQLVSRLQKT
jgi:hypothetical protein